MQTSSEIAIGRMPRFQKSVRLDIDRNRYFERLIDYLALRGFEIEAFSANLHRLAVRQPAREAECGCRYVIWVYGIGPRTRVVFGVKPRFLSFLRCKTGDVYSKLLDMEAVLRAASVEDGLITP
jgi:hypothetical protein